jgi:hypothetical protein
MLNGFAAVEETGYYHRNLKTRSLKVKANGVKVPKGAPHFISYVN